MTSGLPTLQSEFDEISSSFSPADSLSQFLCVAIVPGAIALHHLLYFLYSAAVCLLAAFSLEYLFSPHEYAAGEDNNFH
jgi:hypothetical protein